MNLQHADKLSEPARNLLLGQSSAYQRLVVSGTDGVDAEHRRQVEALAAGGLLARPAASREHGEALLAGWWLWHDFLDESHVISQRIESQTGSFWHARLQSAEIG